VDPATPVLVGVGQAAERLEDADYQRLSAVDLAARAARRAIRDTGADPAAVAAAIDTVAGVRQFEISVPGAPVPLGRSSNFPRSVARLAGAHPDRAILEVVGGQSPQHLVNELAAEIAAGNGEIAMVVGAEAISTEQRFARAEDRPDFTLAEAGDLEDRGYGLEGLFSPYLAQHGLLDLPSQYALFENARRARLGLSRAEYAQAIGALFEPFTRVAAANQYACAPTVRSAAELLTPSEPNRPIADPYTRYVVARDKVNQGAAVLIMSVAAAERLAIAPERWVFLAGHADLRERDLLDRQDLSAGPASVTAARHALEVAGIGVDQLTTIDLYSCFAIPVFTVCDGLGLRPDDPRGLTVTGGLPFFGGPGNNYSLHAIAETVDRLRKTSGGYGFVGANGGVMSKYSVGVYTSAPVGWRPDRSAALQAEIDAWPAPVTALTADGPATIETWTVTYGRDGVGTPIVIGRLADGRRFAALGEAGDRRLLALLGGDAPVGARVSVRWTENGNRVQVPDE
jgi:acetyl-CoA C-acetyltransferase